MPERFTCKMAGSQYSTIGGCGPRRPQLIRTPVVRAYLRSYPTGHSRRGDTHAARVLGLPGLCCGSTRGTSANIKKVHRSRREETAGARAPYAQPSRRLIGAADRGCPRRCCGVGFPVLVDHNRPAGRKVSSMVEERIHKPLLHLVEPSFTSRGSRHQTAHGVRCSQRAEAARMNNGPKMTPCRRYDIH